MMAMLRNSTMLAMIVLVAAACAAREPLPAKSATVPAGIDLSGQWRLRDTSRNSNRQISDAERMAAGEEESLIPKKPSKNQSRRKAKDIQVHVFLETGESLKVTQTGHGLFVSFDRAIVEEYRFGEQRMIAVGPVEADRVSGWENGAYVIETRDKAGAMLIESYRLDDSDTMIRSIQIVYRDEADLDVSQVFDRR